jgi:hypothetical protein
MKTLKKVFNARFVLSLNAGIITLTLAASSASAARGEPCIIDTKDIRAQIHELANARQITGEQFELHLKMAENVEVSQALACFAQGRLEGIPMSVLLRTETMSRTFYQDRKAALEADLAQAKADPARSVTIGFIEWQIQENEAGQKRFSRNLNKAMKRSVPN